MFRLAQPSLKARFDLQSCRIRGQSSKSYSLRYQLSINSSREYLSITPIDLSTT